MMPDKFVVVDVETANACNNSICQIGIVVFENGEITRQWSSLINPQDDFDWMNICIHGITAEQVADAPIFTEIIEPLKSFFDGNTVASYGFFDRLAFQGVLTKYQLPPDVLGCFDWFDITRVVRRTWREFAYSGYGLSNICRYLDIGLNHHDALSDASAAGQILVQAMQETDMGLAEWKQRVEQAIFDEENKEKLKSLKNNINPNGVLFGEVLAITGELSVTRTEFMEYAVQHGCAVSNTVNSKTTMLVCGAFRQKNIELSAKERKTKELLEKGQVIKIMSESDFRRLVENLQVSEH